MGSGGQKAAQKEEGAAKPVVRGCCSQAETPGTNKRHGLRHSATERRPDAVLDGVCSVAAHLNPPAAAAPAPLAALCWRCCLRLCLGAWVGGRLVSCCCCICVCVWGVQHALWGVLNGVAGAQNQGQRDHGGIWQHTQREDACSDNKWESVVKWQLEGTVLQTDLMGKTGTPSRDAQPGRDSHKSLKSTCPDAACVCPICCHMLTRQPNQSQHPDPTGLWRLPGLMPLGHMCMWLTCVVITAENVSVLQPVLLPLDCKHRAALQTQGFEAWLCAHNGFD